MLSVVATIPSPPLALAYVAVFGCGSIGGMMAMSALLPLPLALAAERFAHAKHGAAEWRAWCVHSRHSLALIEPRLRLGSIKQASVWRVGTRVRFPGGEAGAADGARPA